MSHLTSHVLDTACGKPAAGVRIDVLRLADDGKWLSVADGVTDLDGRTATPLLEGAAFHAGTYQLEFFVGAYFAGLDLNDPMDRRFLGVVPVRVGLDGSEDVHIPLLVTPWSYSTYRGSLSMAGRWTVGQLSGLDREGFVAVVGPVFEHTPSIAADAWERRPFLDAHDLKVALAQVVHERSADEQLALLQAHPVLGARRPMAVLSQAEQAGAGLDLLERPVQEQLDDGNRRYLERFGFPFIVAVRGRSPEDVLALLQQRLEHDPAAERATAIDQVLAIAGFRLDDLLEEP